MASKRRQAGFFTIDALFGLIVLSIMLSLAGWWLLKLGNHQDYRIAAEQQRTVADAFAKYLKDNYAVVLSNAGPTTPVQVTVEMMQNTNYLPAGFSSTNSFGQTIVGLARRLNDNQLEAIVVTTGGQAIPELGVRTIAEHLGGPGGFISSLKPGVIQGVRGGWELTLSNYGVNPGQGHTASALFLMDGDLANDYLYRNAVPGHPEYNRMNTALDMGANDINNARVINATDSIISKDGWFRTQSNTGWMNDKWGGGLYQSDADWVRVLNDKGLLTGGKIRSGSVQADGRVTVGEYLDIESTVIEEQACPKIGVQSKDSLGTPFACKCRTPACQQLIWKKISLSLNGKDTQSGSAGTVMSYEGMEAGGLNRYCKHYVEQIESTTLIIMNLQQTAIAQGGDSSYIDAFFYINGRLSGANYSVTDKPGSFGVSSSVTEALQPGTSTIDLCIRNSSVTSPFVSYTVSLIQ